MKLNTERNIGYKKKRNGTSQGGGGNRYQN